MNPAKPDTNGKQWSVFDNTAKLAGAVIDSKRIRPHQLREAEGKDTFNEPPHRTWSLIAARRKRSFFEEHRRRAAGRGAPPGVTSLKYGKAFPVISSYYLIPESHEDLSIRLYQASPFPSVWEYLGNLLEGQPYLDPSIFRFDNTWWLFAYNPDTVSLNLYYSEDLLTGWSPHPRNPIVKSDKNISRPGGRVIVYDDSIYRLAQDGDPYYGMQVFVFEITELSTNAYKEKRVSETPAVKMMGKGWNARGMHRVDAHRVGTGWIAAVDGKS